MYGRIEILAGNYPELKTCGKDILKLFRGIRDSLSRGGTLFTCGNGGSAADAEHIAGELLKSFLVKREEKGGIRRRIEREFGSDGKFIASRIQGGMRVMSLNGHPSFSTAFANDVSPELVFAQHLFAMGRKGDVLLGISTSGNAKNIFYAMIVAKAMGIKTLLLTGADGGRCSRISDVSVRVPSDQTFRIQEYHLPIYHAVCAMLEEHFYGSQK